MVQLVLASTSPYRRQLLARLGLPFDQAKPMVDETPLPGESPLALSLRLAKAKAMALAQQYPQAWLIGSDQVAVCKGRLMGKPGTPQAALSQLQWQRGSVTSFHTAVCLFRADTGESQIQIVSTDVHWLAESELSDAQLQRYIDLESPLDCAGAAKSEGLGTVLIQKMDTPDPTALIGLPMVALTKMLRTWGLDPLTSGR
ncbi:MAG: maf protein [Pseudomonadota bacterium]|jgi:septum formation protein